MATFFQLQETRHGTPELCGQDHRKIQDRSGDRKAQGRHSAGLYGRRFAHRTRDARQLPDSASDEVEGVFVRATVERRCRAGFCFDKEGQGFADGVLSDEQLEALESDPLLKVERCTFSGNQEGE